MQTALRLTGTVQPGGRFEVSSPQLPVGKAVDVIVLFPREVEETRRSVVDVLAEALGHLAFKTAEEVEDYLRPRSNGTCSPDSEEADHLARIAGSYADDPFWEEFVQLMEEARQEADAAPAVLNKVSLRHER